ncbi:hypothetical protein BN844_1727 [Pseudomonas sp. SHC52]|nr:hypothetical protein BN844_1727 [Pseudomonas sp. SHC52]
MTAFIGQGPTDIHQYKIDLAGLLAGMNVGTICFERQPTTEML